MRTFVKIPILSDCCYNHGICGESFVEDIVFDKKGRVVATRFRFRHTSLKTQTDYIRGFTQTQAIADKFTKLFSKRTDT